MTINYTPKQILNRILEGETMSLLFIDKKDYNSFRTSLLTSFKSTCNVFDGLGVPNPYEDKFIQCRYLKVIEGGTFKLEDKTKRITGRPRVYTVISQSDL